MNLFSVVGAEGLVVEENNWRAASGQVNAQLSQDACTLIKIESEKPNYVVLNGSTQDFKNLREGSGFSANPRTFIYTDCRFEFTGRTRAQIVVIEYSKDRTRIADSTVKANTAGQVRLSPNTHFVLVAMRFVGAGTATIPELTIDAGDEELLEGGKVAMAERGKIKAKLSKVLEYTELKPYVKDIQTRLQTVARSLDNSIGKTAREVAAPFIAPSGIDKKISDSREQLARNLLIDLASSIPSSDGSHHFQPSDAKVGIITDEYMFNFYRDSFSVLEYLSPTNYEEKLSSIKFDAILYVTCWKGMAGEEWKGVKFRDAPKLALDSILSWANENSVPTIFQSIEDPSNYDYFLPVARRFDYVFTSDTDMISAYRRDLGHENVYYAEYGANPLVNNPIGMFRFDFDKAFFAGSYPERYPERCADMETIFDSLTRVDDRLLILDRNYDKEGFEFPERFKPLILGPVKHDILQKVHKLFRVSLNFNSIKNSPTMCAMRVYELQAQGKPLISNYALSVFNKFPEIRMVPQKVDLSGVFGEEARESEYERSIESMNRLFKDKTSFDIAARVASIAGLPMPRARSERILVIADSSSADLESALRSQRLVSYDVVRSVDAESRDLNEYGYVAAFEPDLDYGPYYLLSRLNGFKYTAASFVSELGLDDQTGNERLQGHEYVKEANDRFVTMVSTSHPDALDFATGKLSFIRGNGYAVDSFQHSSYPNEAETETKVDSEGREPLLTVVIPIYNNGRFLSGKCIPSLERNAQWNRLKILLIDDGSTDDETLAICKRVESTYSNVSFYGFGDGGSGSASRPRNRGIELADTELISFLDPDNEISPNGYDELIRSYLENAAGTSKCDFVSGYQVKVGSSTSYTGKHANGKDFVVTDAKSAFFNRGKFPVVSTQAAVIRTGLLLENNIRFVERAAGQDTLFGWEVLAASRKARFIDRAFIIYYAERSGSVTNSVDAKYFKKCLTLEKYQVQKLKELDILEAYKSYHFENFMGGWYLKRLALVSPGNRDEAESDLEQIASLYGSTLANFSSHTTI